MSLQSRQRVLNQFDDRRVRKIMIMHWLQRREIWGDEAEQLIHDNRLEDA